MDDIEAKSLEIIKTEIKEKIFFKKWVYSQGSVGQYSEV